MSWSAFGEPVNSPVLMPLFFASVCTRAFSAAIQFASSVSRIIQAQAASGCLALAGMTNAEPPVTLTGLPLLSLNGTAWMSILSLYGERTFGYHCALTWAPTWSFTYWLFLPKVSNRSLKLLILAQPP